MTQSTEANATPNEATNVVNPHQSARVTLIKKQGCVPCASMAVDFDEAGIEFERVDVAEHPEVLEKYNVMSVPVIVIEDDDYEVVLRGYQPVDKIKSLIK